MLISGGYVYSFGNFFHGVCLLWGLRLFQTLEYPNVHSNHPPHIIKQTSKIVELRLSILPKIKEIFERVKPPNEKALNYQGYNYILKYQEQRNLKKRNRSKSHLL